MLSRKQKKEEVFLQQYISGSMVCSDDELRDILLKRYGKEIIETKRETKPTKGLWSSLRRSLNIGGYETEEIPVTFAEKIQDMDGDDLRDFWDNESKRRLDRIEMTRLESMSKFLDFSWSGIFDQCIIDEKSLEFDFSKMGELFEMAKELLRERSDLRAYDGDSSSDLYHHYNLNSSKMSDHTRMNLADMVMLCKTCDPIEMQALEMFFYDPTCVHRDGERLNKRVLKDYLKTASKEAAKELIANEHENEPVEAQKEETRSEEETHRGKNVSRVLEEQGGKLVTEADLKQEKAERTTSMKEETKKTTSAVHKAPKGKEKTVLTGGGPDSGWTMEL